MERDVLIGMCLNSLPKGCLISASNNNVSIVNAEFDTSDNRQIIVNIIDNYDTLAPEWIAAERKRRKHKAYKMEADPIYVEWMALKAIEHPDSTIKYNCWVTKREEIDMRFSQEE